MKRLITLFTWTILANASARSEIIRYQDLISRKPDHVGRTVKVWTIKKTDVLRVNLVEMSGELALHKHPDAAHSLMVLEGSIKVQIGNQFSTLETGDFVSIPADVPHKYWALTPRAMLVSMDAPYYRTTIPLE